VQAQDFLVRGVQIVAFTVSAGFEASQVLTGVLSRYGALLSGRVEVLPLPEEVPPEIPRIVLGSKDGRWSLSSAPARTSVEWVERESNGISPDQLDAIVRQSSEILACCFAEEAPMLVNRLGFLLTSVFETEDAPRVLIEQFCRPQCHAAESAVSPLRHSQTFQLHNFKAYMSQLDAIPINSWVRCKSALLVPNGPSAIVVEQDLNTNASDPERRFEPIEMRTYFERAVPEAQQILRLFFPD
jgi:hypothetical protein